MLRHFEHLMGTSGWTGPQARDDLRLVCEKEQMQRKGWLEALKALAIPQTYADLGTTHPRSALEEDMEENITAIYGDAAIPGRRQ